MKRLLALLALATGAAFATSLSASATAPPDCVPRDSIPPTQEVREYTYKKHASTKQGGVGAYFGFQGGSPSEGPYSSPQSGFDYGGSFRTVGVPFQIGSAWYIIVESSNVVVAGDPGDPGNVPPDECFPPPTEPPSTEPPVTEPPGTEPPVTEPPVTEPPATEPPDTTAPTEPIDPGPVVVAREPSPTPPAAVPAPQATPAGELPATGGEMWLALVAAIALASGLTVRYLARRPS